MSEFRNLLMSKGGGGNVEQWMLDAVAEYGIPLNNLQKAYAIDKDIKKSFDGTKRWIVSDGKSYFDTGVKVNQENSFLLNFKDYLDDSKSIIGPSEQSWLYSFLFRSASGRSTWRYYPDNINSYRVDVDSVKKEGEHSVIINKESFLLDGIPSFVRYDPIDSVSGTMCLFTGQGGPSRCSVSLFSIKNEFEYHLYIPIIKYGEVTMIDLVTMTFPTKYGTFIIE